MAHRTTSSAMAGLALLGFATCAAAANPFGSAVAGAPSLFVLAVVESRANSSQATVRPREGEPSRDVQAQTQAQAPERVRQASSQSSQRTREQGDHFADERKVTQR